MKKLLDNDTFLKILSLVISALFWIYIIFINNPEIEVSVKDIPVTLSDHQTIKNAGYTVSTGVEDTVDIKIKGTRKMLANISRDNIIAYIDLSDCVNKGTFNLPVTVKLPYEEIKIVSKSVHNVSVAVDYYISRSFEIGYNYKGELKSSDYKISDTELSSTRVRIRGPQDIIKTIEKASVDININKADEDINGYAPVKLYNSKNNEVLSNALEIDVSEVSYKTTLSKTKTVDVKPTFSGDTADIAYKVTDYPSIKITGPVADIDNIDFIETENISYNKESLPHNYTARLLLPGKIEVENKIKTVTVLVEKD